MANTLSTPPILSRPHLRKVAAWIRDELDLLIAQGGPESLSIDDVLTLHELFQALRASSTLTALDLRATGIHRAVMEVAGIATRWPGRLADDCDKIIAVWQARFGRLEDLHPFMYGRGGRLEGIANVEELSKTVHFDLVQRDEVAGSLLMLILQALLERWTALCPEKIANERSRRFGDLGFKPGAWWINPLFAHHAGIIDLNSADGGICHDHQAAYALVLCNSSEIQESNGISFTYRPRHGDKGRFRLTAASAKSRLPVRVLRNHSLNSIWGPRAGVRYDGLYRTAGWVIRTARHNDNIGHEYKAGDIIYEIKLERVDITPLEEVVTHPTSHELDDYLEYKRLRRLYRKHRHRPGASVAPPDVVASGKIAPAIASAMTITPLLQLQWHQRPSSPSRKAIHKEPLASPRSSLTLTRPSPSSSIRSTIPPVDSVEMSSGELSPSSLGNVASSAVHASVPFLSDEVAKREPLPISHKDTIKAKDKESDQALMNNIMDVIPWMSYDSDLIAAATGINVRANRAHLPVSEQLLHPTNTRKNNSDSSVSPTQTIHLVRRKHRSRQSGDSQLRGRGSKLLKGQKSIIASHPQSSNAPTIPLDGTEDEIIGGEDRSVNNSDGDDVSILERKRSSPLDTPLESGSAMIPRELLGSSSGAEAYQQRDLMSVLLDVPAAPLPTNCPGDVGLTSELNTLPRLDHKPSTLLSSKDFRIDTSPTRPHKGQQEELYSTTISMMAPHVSLKRFITTAQPAAPISVYVCPNDYSTSKQVQMSPRSEDHECGIPRNK